MQAGASMCAHDPSVLLFLRAQCHSFNRKVTITSQLSLSSSLEMANVYPRMCDPLPCPRLRRKVRTGALVPLQPLFVSWKTFVSWWDLHL